MKHLFNKPPQCLSAFVLKTSEDNVASSWNSGDEFITQKIHCQCINDIFFISTSNLTSKTGLFKKKIQIEYLAPVYISCSKCQEKKLLFNPKIHGWDGIQNQSVSRIGEHPPELFDKSPGTLFVNYSYQNEKNYKDLIEDGCANPEDFFDTFTIYFKSDILREVVSYECA